MELLEELLLSGEYTNIFSASNGTDALKIFSENSKIISFILLDMNWREMGGIDFITHLKNIHNYPVGIIGITGLIDEENANLFYKAGSETVMTLNYFVKPFDFEKVLTAVDSAIQLIQKKRLEHIKEYSESLLSELDSIRSKLDQVIKNIKTFLII